MSAASSMPDEPAAAVIAKDGLAGYALDLRARFQLELGGGVVARWEDERRARLRRFIGRLLQACRLVDAASGH
jgi:hypothetical protein